jgi:5-oxoprolinase (ATP-hydrolysing) subunit C
VLKVLAPGLYSLLVDHGRPHSRSLGVPVGGPADLWSFQFGNALVGNPPETTALEICLAGPTLQATSPVACVVYGAPFDLLSNRQSLQCGKTFTLLPDETLTIGGTASGMRAYLCVRGGFHAPQILESRSALAPLQAGSVLDCPSTTIGPRFMRSVPRSNSSLGEVQLRILPGGQCDWFSTAEFCEQTYRVLAESNRMGLRLRGKPLSFARREMMSEPVCPGTVQVTSDGQLIVLGVDGQTIGGYPRIAHVVRADLHHLGQFRPGESVRFLFVSLAEAQRLQQQGRAVLEGWLNRLRHTEILVPSNDGLAPKPRNG